MKVLFVTSEAFPLIKTGGLADVSGSLPSALTHFDVDIRILIPGYSSVLQQLSDLTSVATISNLPMVDTPVELLLGTIKDTGVKVITIRAPDLYERNGGPYTDMNGLDWADNAIRFALLSKIGAILSAPHTPLTDWQPDLVHCNDWQTGLTPAYMKLVDASTAGSIISLHNMAFQGIFPASLIGKLGLPPEHFITEGYEYYGQISFLKAGIFYADTISTVSPTYAKEIQTQEFGFGLEGLLAKRGHEMQGILNGIETDEWNPATDPYLVKKYSVTRIAGKKEVKAALQKTLGLKMDAGAPLLGVVSRLTYQKGLDILLPDIPKLLDDGCQLVLLGSGETGLETAFSALAHDNPGKMSVTIGYNEPLSHQIMAGCDMFIMPSRFEPCGLNQMYGLAYGTLPIVNATGGLADSVIDTSAVTLKNKTANGFVMADTSSGALLAAVERALDIYKEDPKTWRKIQKNGMSQNLSWDHSAQEYLDLYKKTIQNRGILGGV